MITVKKYSTGNVNHGGFDYEELTVRDSRGMIVGYALLDSREENYESEKQMTIREFEQDFGR